MNIFATRKCPYESAKDQCDKLASKMCAETVQVLVQSALTAGVPPELMPLTKTSQRPHRGGYPHHPACKWAGESISNWTWLFHHGVGLCQQFFIRFGKEHFARSQLDHLIEAFDWHEYFPNVGLTPFRRCFNQSKGLNLDLLDEDLWPCPHEAYREFYRRDKVSFAKWERGVDAPEWWDVEMEAIV